MVYDISDTKSRMHEMLKDKNIRFATNDTYEERVSKKEKRNEIKDKYNTLIEKKKDILKEYKLESEVHRNLQ